MGVIKKGQKVLAIHPVTQDWSSATATGDSGMSGSFSDPDRQPVVPLEWEDGYRSQQPLEFVEVEQN